MKGTNTFAWPDVTLIRLPVETPAGLASSIRITRFTNLSLPDRRRATVSR